MGTERSADERAAVPEAATAAPQPAAVPARTGVDALMRMQRTIGNQALQRWLAEPAGQAAARAAAGPRAIQRREVRSQDQIASGRDWTTADRTGNTQRWKDACMANLNALDSSQYRRIVERRDFYWWFYNHTAARGWTTRWALAAAIVANGAHQIADMDEDHETANDALGMANVQLQGMMREGNQVIFDNVLPKLKRLLDGGPLTGPQAMQWDMQVLADEQTLVQPMYARMSQETKDQLEYIARQRRFAGWGAWLTNEAHVDAGAYHNAGDVPAFDQPDLQSIGDRWRYGMGLGNTFAPGGTGFNPATHTMPTAGSEYTSGAEFNRLSNRRALHQLDAYLNPNRLSRVGSGSDEAATIAALTDREKQEVLADSSPDGWAYSTAFAQFSFIPESLVRSALPSAPSPAVDAFMARWRAERRRLELRYPTPSYGFYGL